MTPSLASSQEAELGLHQFTYNHNHMKRTREFSYIENPFIKAENRRWNIREPASLARSVSPPTTSSRHKSTRTRSTAASVEAGEEDVENHLLFFSQKLLEATRPDVTNQPRIDYQSWLKLYTSNATNASGHHFVIHQHDHPVAGTHYDLRLQCNETSSVSWAIMYGLPGDPNSQRLNRNATETRIHCLWNHLVETASHQTGTLLIWDTGTYEILPHRDTHTQSGSVTTDEEGSEDEGHNSSINPSWNSLSEPQKLHASFQSRRIRLRLHGTRLPRNYTVLLWLRRENDRAEQPPAPKIRRKKGPPSTLRRSDKKSAYSTDSDRNTDTTSDTDAPTTYPTTLRRNVSSLHRHESPPPTTTPTPTPTPKQPQSTLPSYPKTPNPTPPPTTTPKDIAEKDLIRQNNAYPGALNSINSIHQRRWFLALDRVNSGFVKTCNGKWIPSSPSHLAQAGDIDNSRRGRTSHATSSGNKTSEPGGFTPFHVLGREHERSIVTARSSGDILSDEGVVGFVPRGKWRAVVE